MQAKNVLKSKNGITPVLATLLLIAIAAAAIVVTYAWVMIYMGGARQSASVMLNIEVVSWSGNDTIVLYVRNTGTSDTTISAVYIGTSATNLSKVDDVTFDTTGGVVRANGGIVEIKINYKWANDTMYYFKVVPSIGASAETSNKSPP
jgi:hypothetical protein